MTVELNVKYQGDLRCEMRHMPSGNSLLTDAPTDNHGRGETFSPTDLVSGSLGACFLTIMGIAANRDSIDITGASARVVKEMAANPRRIGKLTVEISLPKDKNFSEGQIEALKRAIKTCPVFESLHPRMEKEIVFQF